MGVVEGGIGAWIVGASATGATATAAGMAAAAAINIAVAAALSAGASALAAEMADKGPNKATRTGNVKQPLSPHEWVYGSVRKGGVIFYVNGSGPENSNLHLCIAFAAHEIESFDEVYINGELVGLRLVKPSDYTNPLDAEGPFRYSPFLDDSYQLYLPGKGYKRKNFISFQFRTGTATQTPVPIQVLQCSNWTAAHQAKGIAYLYARLNYDSSGKAWPSFIPAFTARVKGKRIFDPRTNAVAWGDNPALILADVLENLLGVPRARIDSAALIEAANICDQVVPLKGGGTEKRYRAGGYLIIEGEPEDWIEPIKAVMAGAVIEHHGIYYIHAGAWRPPVIEITDADIMGGIKVRTAESDRDRANVCRGMFSGIESYDQPTDFPQISDAAAIAEDGSEQAMELNLEWCPSPTQAQRVAKIALKSARFGRTIEIGVNLLKGLDVKPWDTVTLRLRAFGLTGTFRVITHVVSVSDGAVKPILTLQEIAESVYAWDPATEEQKLQVDAALIPGTDIEPDNLKFTTAVNSSGSTFVPATVNATWEDAANVAFQAIEIEAIVHFQYRIGSGSWVDAVAQTKGEALPGAESIALAITDETMGSSAYSFQGVQVEQVRIRTRVNPEAWSEWVEVQGDLQAPIAGAKTLVPYASRGKHQPASVKMSWSPPTNGTPAKYEAEVVLSYQWRLGSTGAWNDASFGGVTVINAKSFTGLIWDKTKPQSNTQFQNHAITRCRVRAILTDGTVSSWTDI